MEREPGVVVGRTQKTVRIGTVIAEKYRVEQEIGRGGFGIVVRARHLMTDQMVAIKILTAGEGGEAEWKEDAARFKREARATAALRSEHVVRIFDVDFMDSGSPYMVMEYLEGETLHHTIHARGPLPIGEAVDHVVEVLAALGEAHAAGIVHRDLKPANVFITKGPGGTPVAKVLDFGVSKIAAASTIGATTGNSPITKTGSILGTITYMAPEQMIDAKRVDARADLWSAGILLYELLTQQTPFGVANDANLVTTMLTKPPIPLSSMRPDIPPKLEKIVMRLLAREPDNRYATAAKVGAALAHLTTPRARSALDSLKRSGRPTGAAAPIEKGAPQVLRGTGAGAGAGPQGGVTTTSRRGMSGLTKTIIVVCALVTVGLIGVTVGILFVAPKVASPRIAPKPAPSVTASAP